MVEVRKPLHLLRYLRPYRGWVLLAPLAMGIEVVMDLSQPALMKGIVDDGIAAGNTAVVLQTGWRMLVYALVGALGGFACTFVSSKAALGFGNDLRTAMFNHTLRLSFAQTDKFTTGSLTTRLTGDITTMQFVVIMFTRMMLRAPFLLIGSIALVLQTNWRLALPLLCSAPILSFIVVRFMGRLIPLFRESQKRTDTLNNVMQETLSGIRVVKAFAGEEQENARFSVANGSLNRISVQSGLLHVYLSPALGLVQHLTVVAILFFAARQVDAGLLKVGEVTAIVNWASQVMMSLIMLSFHVMHYSRAAVSARRICEVLSTEPDVKSPSELVASVAQSSTSGAYLEFKNVSFSYPMASGEPVLKDVSLSIKRGEHIAIIGATGSGKSTLLSLLPRFYDVTSGAILLDGVDVRYMDLEELRAKFGIVMQNPRLFSGTIADNIRWGEPSATDEDVRRVCRLAQANGFIEEFPDGYNTAVSQGGTTVSGGQRQRLCIARALLRGSAILLLDDATSAVDTVTERAIREALRKEASGTTVLTVAQKASTVMQADRIIVLDQGRVVGIGTHLELMESCAVYRDIIDSQSLN